MTLGQLKHSLRKGAKPETLGDWIGGGCSREAYKVGAFVVKESQDYTSKSHYDLEALRRYGLRMAPTVRVGLWEIQLHYPHHVEDGEYPNALRGFGDLHPDNLAKDRRGRLVAFDW
jgi:hypothetical protein